MAVIYFIQITKDKLINHSKEEGMDVLKIVLTASASFIILFLLTKLMGKRQISQLTLFDYINGITIGSIAAEMATNLEDNVLLAPTAMVIFALLTILFNVLTTKSILFRRIITGKALILYSGGKLYCKNLSKVHMDVNEFLSQCRMNGYFDLSNIHTAVMEPNGQISILPVSTQRPVTPQDMSLYPKQEQPAITIIIDGKIMQRNLKHTGKDEAWLTEQLSLQNIESPEEVFLAIYESSGKLAVFERINDNFNWDIFQ